MEFTLRGIGAPTLGQLQIHGPLGGVLRMNRDADRKRRSIERQNARLRLDAHADRRRDHQRLVHAAHTGDVRQRLHHLPEPDGNAVERELRPRGQRIGRKGALAPRLVGDVVVWLLRGGPREVAARWAAASSGTCTWKVRSPTGAPVAVDRSACIVNLPRRAIGRFQATPGSAAHVAERW